MRKKPQTPAGREKRCKLPNLLFQHEYEGGDYYYIRECYEEYYRHVEHFILTGDRKNCLMVSGTPGIGTSVFYAFFFQEFWKAHRAEWIVVLLAYREDGSLKGFAVFEDGVETKLCTSTDEMKLTEFLCGLHQQLVKLAGDQDGKKRVKKIAILCDGIPRVSRPNMVVFTSPNENWFRMNEKDDHFLFMPLWTSDELHGAALALDLDLDYAEIARRVEVFGGTARFCLSPDTNQVTLAKQRLLKSIEAITDPAELGRLLSGKSSGSTRFHLLHIEPLPDDKGYWTTKIASSFVRVKLEKRLKLLDFPG